MTENFNRQFILFDYKQLDDPVFLNFFGTTEFKTFLLLLRYIWRGGFHRLGLDELYSKEQLLVAAVDRGFLAQKLRLQDETRVSKHLTKLEELKLVQRMRTRRETIFVLGEWLDISEEKDGSAKKEWFYYERVFGKNRGSDSSNETRKGGDEGSTTSDVAQNATSEVHNTPHQRWPETPQQMWQGEPRNNIKNKYINKTVNVNGFKEKGRGEFQQGQEPSQDKTDLRRLPDLNQPKDQTQVIAQTILEVLGDHHSQAFYYLVAAKVPEQVIRKALSEIKNDGARFPAKVFVHRMKAYAEEHFTSHSRTNHLAPISDLLGAFR
jgi:hypothetical protein